MGTLSGWSYYKDIVITGQAGTGPDYQIELEIGDSAGGDFHLEGHCTNFPQDIRITDDDGTTLLDHWVEDITADPIVVHVEVKDDLGSNQTIKVYYGKSGETTASDGATTFPIFFEDFPGSSIDTTKWVRGYSNGSTSVSGSILTITGAAGLWEEQHTINAVSQLSTATRMKVKTGNELRYFQFGMGTNGLADLTDNAIVFNDLDVKKYMHGNNGTSTIPSRTTAYNVNYITLEIQRISASLIKFYENNVLGLTGTVNVPDSNMDIYFGRRETSTVLTDWVFVRKYHDPEPTFSSAGAEQSLIGWSNTIIGVSSPGKVNGIAAADISKIIGVA